jgi:hypothetical protein
MTTIGYKFHGALLGGLMLSLTACPGDDSASTGSDGSSTGEETTSVTDPTVTVTMPSTMTTDPSGDTTMGTDPTDATTDPTDTTTDPSTTTGETGDTGDVCGDDVIGGAEVCDGAELGGATCESEGFAGGTLACDAMCAFDTTGCVDAMVTCVDVAADKNCVDADPATCTCQACDPGNGCEASEDCVCPDCAADAFCADPANCNNDGECDPYLEGCGCADCAGHVECGPPPVCGNDSVEPGEDCDGADLGGEDCTTLGFPGGAIGCNPDCTFDTSGCDPMVAVGFGDCFNNDPMVACLVGEACLNAPGGAGGFCSLQDCVDAMDCPVPATGNAAVVCADGTGDMINDCALLCDMGETCPDGMACFMNTVCLWD